MYFVSVDKIEKKQKNPEVGLQGLLWTCIGIRRPTLAVVGLRGYRGPVFGLRGLKLKLCHRCRQHEWRLAEQIMFLGCRGPLHHFRQAVMGLRWPSLAFMGLHWPSLIFVGL